MKTLEHVKSGEKGRIEKKVRKMYKMAHVHIKIQCWESPDELTSVATISGFSSCRIVGITMRISQLFENVNFHLTE
jgi:hypothetical protein